MTNIKENLIENIETASRVNAFLKSKEWQLFEEIIDKKEKDLFTIFLNKPKEDLATERQGLEYCKEIINEFKDLVNTGIKAKMDLTYIK